MGIELTTAAKVLLATRGYDPAMGARPLRRTIQREIEDQLSEKILFGELHAGDIVVVDVEGEGDDAQVHLRRQRQAAHPGDRPERLSHQVKAPPLPHGTAGPSAVALPSPARRRHAGS